MQSLVDPSSRALVAWPWLLRVRWIIVAGQVVVILVSAYWLRIPLPLSALGALVALAALTNLVAQVAGDRLPARHRGGSLLLFDVVQLTGLLWLTDGPLNPFSMMFLVYITLAAVVLESRWTWTIATAAGAGFGALFLAPVDEHSALAHALAGQVGGHLQGMWWAFAIAAVLTAVFVVRLSREIDARDAELAATRESAARSEQLARLTTLAAGAAHELGTPLATIAVAARELERAVAMGHSSSEDALADIQLIQAQVDRARHILDRLARRAGDPPGEMPQRLLLTEVFQRVVALLPSGAAGRVQVNVGSSLAVFAPANGFVEALAGLVRNALDAGADSVHVGAALVDDGISLTIRDTGVGIDPQTLARVGEPFFTTKVHGQGMGLGVFLARLLATELQGELTITSTVDVGTTVTWRLPAAQ